MHRHSKLLLAAKSQQATNDGHLKKRYTQYKTTPMLRQRNLKDITDFSDVDHNCQSHWQLKKHVMVEHRSRQQPILSARKWIKDPWRHLDTNGRNWGIGNYRKRTGNRPIRGEDIPGRGLVTTIQVPIVYGFRKTWYTVTNLVSTREYFADIKASKAVRLRPRFCNPIEHRSTGFRQKCGKQNFGA